MEYSFGIASMADIENVFALYGKRVRWMDEIGIKQWNVTSYLKVYPIEYYMNQLSHGNLYVLKDENRILGAVVLLQNDDRWTDRVDSLAYYVHNLVSDPAVHGAGKRILEEVEKLAIRNGKQYIRLDCAVDNAFLNRYYETLGYLKTGICRDGEYIGNRMEKMLCDSKMNNNQNMQIRKAGIEDIDKIEKIYDRIHDEEEAGRTVIGWIRNVYPIRKTAEDSLNRDDLFVMEEDGEILATAIINKIQVPDYAYAEWRNEADDDEIMVLHTLIVDPLQKGKGYGKAFVSFYEDYALKNGCHELRMDTNAKNERARAMYKKLGYEEVGIVSCVFNGIPDVQLVCLEKNLND